MKSSLDGPPTIFTPRIHDALQEFMWEITMQIHCEQQQLTIYEQAQLRQNVMMVLIQKWYVGYTGELGVYQEQLNQITRHMAKSAKTIDEIMMWNRQ